MNRGFEAVSILTLVAVGACAAAGCSSSPSGGDATSTPQPGNGSQQTGSLTAELQVGGVSIGTVTYAITGPGAFNVSNSVNFANSSALSFVVGGVPAGNGYTISLSATSVDGGTTCAGSALFSVTAGKATQVTIALDCHQAPTNGSVGVNGTTNVCPAIDALSVQPSNVVVGSSVSLTSAAHDPDNGPSPLAYAWTSSSGSLGTPSAQNSSFTCTAPGVANITLTVSDGDTDPGCPATLTTSVTCTAPDAGSPSDAGASSDATTSDGSAPDATADAAVQPQALLTTLGPDAGPTVALINLGTAIGEGSANGGTPPMVTDLASDPKNTQTIAIDGGDFLASGSVPDPAAVLCTYPSDGGAPARIQHVTGAKFETSQTDPLVPLTPAYFPLVYNSAVTTTAHAFGTAAPLVGLFDWRPKDLDESVLVAESDDNGKTWYFMQSVLELNPDYTNPVSGGYTADGGLGNGCPPTVTGTNANTSYPLANDSQDDDGWGHAAIIQLPGAGNAGTGGQFLYLLDRNTNNIPGTGIEIVDGNPLWVINLAPVGANGGPTPKFPIFNTNFTGAGNNDIKSISSALNQTPDAAAPFLVTQTVGLTDPDGIMAVFPTSASAPAGSPVTVLWVQKILNGDNTGSTALPVAEQCTKAPFSGKTNHDIATVRLATTTDGIHFTDLGAVNGLSDPTTVDYNKNRWVSPRGTLIDIFGNQSRWGLYFAAGNCLDGDSDAFHYIGYAESSDMVNWTIYNDINHPIASINPITTTNQATGQIVTIPANAPIVPTQSWFAERLYAPTATQVDATHLSLTFAGYGVQTPNNDLLDYRQIGNVVLTVSQPLPAGVPNNINAH
jgi:hypothetical protein